MSDILSELAFIFARLDGWGLIDILLVTLVIYSLFMLVRGTQAVVLLRGIIVLVVSIALLTTFFRLSAFSWLLRNTVPALLISIPVIFAPEIRRALERLGRAGITWRFGPTEHDALPVAETLANAAQRLSERRHGGLIVIERQVGLKNYTDTGVRLDAQASVELLLQIFYPNTPLHDGAVMMKGERIVAAACIMPLTSGENLSDRQMGLRHRAALGITEVSDAVAIVVSEETGVVSVAHNGRMIRRLDAARLKNILTAFYRPQGNALGGRWRDVFTAREKEISGD